MAQLRHVQSGSPLRIPANDWNKIVDATRAYYEQQAGGRGPMPATAGAKQTGIVLVRNDSGADLARNAVVGINSPIILPGDHLDEFLRQVALTVVTPTEDEHAAAGHFAVLLDPLAAGGIGRAYVNGICPVQIELLDEQHTTAGVIDGDTTKLESGKPGTQIIWHAPGDAPGSGSGSSVVWALVNLGTTSGGDWVWGKLGGATSIGDNRWSYPFTQMKYQQAGTWAAVPDGLTGTAYNTVEANNSATGVQGCGINVDLLPAGVSIQPIGAGGIVKITPEINCETQAVEHVFEAVNNADGPCEGGGA
jgi:hypothetical protein